MLSINKLDPKKLHISKAYINAGPIIKRMEPRGRARGRADDKEKD